MKLFHKWHDQSHGRPVNRQTSPATCQSTIMRDWWYDHVTAWFVTRFNLWLRHNLWPQNASICDPARFVTKSASICYQRYTMILDCKLCRGKLVFVFTLIMYTEWYNIMHIYIYELWYNTYTNGGARSLMLFYTNTIWISCMTYKSYSKYAYHIKCVIRNINWCIFLS